MHVDSAGMGDDSGRVRLREQAARGKKRACSGHRQPLQNLAA
jgi:hypothetical protein